MQTNAHDWVDKPWGRYKTVWEADNKKMKILEVYPSQRFSLQYHQKRAEVWTLVEGKLIAKIDGVNHKFNTFSQRVHIPKKSIHRLTNTSQKTAVVFEIQYGICEEDDIVRLEDDYGRIEDVSELTKKSFVA